MDELRVTYQGLNSGDHPYSSSFVPISHDDADDDPDAYLTPFMDGLPTTGRDQDCAICGDREPTWVHRLDPDKITYREYGKGHTLPTFWTLCAACERAYSADELDALADRWEPHEELSAEDLAETVRKPIGVFALADIEVRALQPSVRGPVREHPTDVLRREVEQRLADAGLAGRFEVIGVSAGDHGRRVSLRTAEAVTPELRARLDAALDGIDYRLR